MESQNNDLKMFEEIKKIKESIDNKQTEEENKLISDYIESLKRTEENQKRLKK